MVNSIKAKVINFKSNLNIRKTIQLVWSISKGWTTLALIMIVLETIFLLASYYSLKPLIDVFSKTNLENLSKQHLIIKYISIAGTIGVLYAIIRSLSSYTSEVQAAKVSESIDDKIHEIAANLDLSFYESSEYFDILKRARDAGSYRPNQLILAVFDIIKNLLSLIGAALLLLSISWILLPTLILFTIPTLLIRVYFYNKQNTLRIKHTPAERKAYYLSQLITSDTNAKEIRGYHLGNYFKKQYFQIRMDLLDERLKISYKRTLGEAITSGVSYLGFFVCIAYIMLKAVTNGSGIGNVAIFLLVFPQIFNILQGIATGMSGIYQNNTYVASIFELFNLKSEIKDESNTKPIIESIKDIELKNVNFTYAGTDKPVLTDINLKIPSGKIIAIVGLNGAGKTTLIKLLCRLYDPTSGQITLGDEDIRNFSKYDYGKQISVVFQDFCKYNFTAADNIKFGDIDRPEHKLEDIIAASKNSGADGYITNFELQYDTMMGKVFQDGQEISIGQWQKLATARALYTLSNFLILDEATSALDAVAEKDLFDSFRKHIGNRAALVISHRHSAVKHADYIYVLSNGRISQQGTDEQLLAMEGDYSQLFGNIEAAD